MGRKAEVNKSRAQGPSTDPLTTTDSIGVDERLIDGMASANQAFIESQAKKNEEFVAAALRVHDLMRAELDSQPGFEESEHGSAVANLEDRGGNITETPNTITLLQGDNIRLSRELAELRERMDKFAHVVLQNWGKVI